MNKLDLVTGGGGFIGSHLVDSLLAAGRRVRVLDSFLVGRRSNLAAHEGRDVLEIVAGDVRDRTVVDAAMDGVDRVFHLAAMADIVPSVQDPSLYFSSNVDGTFNVLEAARAAGVARFVYAASSSCYGVPDVYPTPETAEIRPCYPYALTKYLGERLVLHWAEVYGLPALSLRFFNVYGPRARTSGSYGAVFGVFLAQLRHGRPLTVVGDGTQSRDFTFVSDVVAALAAAAASDLTGRVLNVGTGTPVSVNRIVELFGAAETVALPKRPGEPDVTHADIGAIRDALGWEPKVPIEEGVAVMLDRLEEWSDSPVWTPAAIEEATRDWFRYLAPPAARGS